MGRSFLRWGTVKVKLLETNAPQKILMIRFETKTWLMENQVKLSCFSPVSVHLEIWLQLFWRLLDQNQSRFDRKKGTRSSSWSWTFVQLHLKSFYWIKTLNYQSDDWRPGGDCEWNRFNSKVLIMLIIWSFRNLHSKYDTVGFKGWKVIKVLKTFPLHSQMQIEGGTQYKFRPEHHRHMRPETKHLATALSTLVTTKQHASNCKPTLWQPQHNVFHAWANHIHIFLKGSSAAKFTFTSCLNINVCWKCVYTSIL